MYWFGHKMPASWRYLLMEPACRRSRTLISGGRRKGAFEGWFWKIPRRNCTLPKCRGPGGGAPLVLRGSRLVLGADVNADAGRTVFL